MSDPSKESDGAQASPISSPQPARAGRRYSTLSFFLILIPCAIAANRATVWLADSDGWKGTPRESSQPAPSVMATADRPKPSVIITPESLDFKEAWESETFAWDLVFRNESDTPRLLRRFGVGCGCTKLEGVGEVRLGPGGEARVKCVIDLTQIRAQDPAPVRDVGVDITAEVTEPDSPDPGGRTPSYRWRLQGQVRRFLECSATEIGLAESLIRGQRGRPVAFRIRPAVPIRRLELQTCPEGWTAEITETEPGKDRVYILRAIPRKLAAGPFRDTFEVIATDAEGRDLPVLRLKAEGQVTENVEVHPAVKDLGEVPVGRSTRAVFSVSARNGDPVEVVSVEPAEPLTAVMAIRPHANTAQVEVERRIDAPGAGNASGTIWVKSGQQTRQALQFKLRWYGTEGPEKE
ncbi:MAG TPA: hypothetical protein VFW33_10455 [Gemmataceae bacterium]|nr:hypothetical protein [Gemmataceae bacterium]